MSRSNVKLVLSIASVLLVAPFAFAGGAERPAVVTVWVWTGGETPERATGTVVAPGRVLTVAHVLEGAKRVEVLGGGMHGGEAAGGVRGGEAAGGVRGGEAAGPPPHAATVVWRDVALDLALLHVPQAKAQPVRFAHADGELRILTVREGSVPAGVRRHVIARLVDQPGRPRRPSLELAASVGAGDSGAPVVDARGAVVAVVYARSTRRGGTAYAVRVAGRDDLRPGCRQVTGLGGTGVCDPVAGTRKLAVPCQFARLIAPRGVREGRGNAGRPAGCGAMRVTEQQAPRGGEVVSRRFCAPWVGRVYRLWRAGAAAGTPRVTGLT